MITESKIFETDDQKVKERVDAKNELESYVFSEVHFQRHSKDVIFVEGTPIP